ncbi:MULTISPECIES: ComF family protein [unclassified Solwaraspora]|uniref:ComF family protein n=1 Tax=unclassified Solwaraspora TaxID=2627926 RepID=UPI00248B6F5E|nr:MULTISPECIES: ComF family protein [unclassified Solwaraspora]WBB96137.1 ComF family protein [Solwaraspora sp. WMMA2059]WBC19958.1 ComF family protein [Solwaraspora sp. WMMA2080]WJK32445.1 ComF family protein [Solwaraspora sp. WMMA2065]
MVGDVWSALADLVLPAECAGCRRTGGRLRFGVCGRCADEVQRLRPRPVRPEPAPPDLPPCVALGEYAGVLRELLLAYKERGRHGLGRPLGRLLGDAVAAAVGTGADRPVLLVPVPSTAAAARARHGDHLARLTRYAAARLRVDGRRVTVARPLRARTRPDSAGMDSAARLASARTAFRPRRVGLDTSLRADPRLRVIVVDDIVTTGATLAAVHRLLVAQGLPAYAAVVLAATRRRHLR